MPTGKPISRYWFGENRTHIITRAVQPSHSEGRNDRQDVTLRLADYFWPNLSWGCVMSSESAVAFRDVAFRYETALEPLFSGVSVHFPRGFTGIIGANGVGKTTLLHLATGTLAPESGTVQRPAHAIYCAQRTDDPPAGLIDLLDDTDGEAYALRGRLGVEPEFLERWNTLSHGERKRAQIAHALWQAPALLAIDEPTNHIDVRARELLIDSLRRFRGVGLIVSHDRDLLDELCAQCLWLEPPNASVFPGGFTKAREQRELNRETAIREHDKAVRERDQLQREIVRRREQASRSHRERSKRGIDIKDHDARFKKNLARLTGKDGQAGRLLRQMDGRAAQADARLAAAQVDRVHDVGIWLPGSRSRRNTLFSLEPGEIPLGGGRVLRFPRLAMKPEDRVAITGLNGLGKSTLLRHLLPGLNVPAEHLTEMPQEVDASMSRTILDAARALPRKQLGHVMNVVSRLGSRPNRLLESRQPSPGELRKLLLALGMARAPHLIVMDEPTNHLDLPSIEALENALADCPCGLLLVSHDQRFLDRLVDTTWHIEADEHRNSFVTVR